MALEQRLRGYRVGIIPRALKGGLAWESALHRGATTPEPGVRETPLALLDLIDVTCIPRRRAEVRSASLVA